MANETTKKKDYVIVSFSGGKDSSAVVLRMIELGEHIDEVLCCDTFKEFPAMYRHIEKVKKLVEEAGIKFTMLRAEQTFDYFMFDHKAKSRNGNPQRCGYSWASSRIRWCTTRLKINVINKYIKQMRSQYNLIQIIGIAFDEEYRLERENNQQENMRFPLVEWGWTEHQALQYCYSKGFDWEGLYELFDRVSCWCCPLQSLEDLRILRKNFPDLWQELQDMDKRTWRKFRPDYSVEELEKRFAFEEERKAQGLSITNRDFHQQLKERLNTDLSQQI